MTKVIILSTTTECSYNFWSKNIFKSYESQMKQNIISWNQ